VTSTGALRHGSYSCIIGFAFVIIGFAIATTNRIRGGWAWAGINKGLIDAFVIFAAAAYCEKQYYT
jgi:hypothetical protein